MARPAHRVVSLLPSATEIVATIGCADRLVGISHECDFPDSVRGTPVLTRSRLMDTGSSLAIDSDVRRLVSDALSIYSVDPEGLREAAPELVITQDLCEVCAVSLDDVRAAVARLAHREDIQVVTLSPTRLEHVLDDLLVVGDALGVAERARAERQALQTRIDAIASRAANARRRPRVLSVEWLDPIMLGGTWMPELIELAGGRAIGAEAGAPAPTVSLEEMVALEPEVVVLKPCGFSQARSLQESERLEQLRVALGEARVYLADGNAFFNRPGPRLVESLEILAACTHPELFGDLAAAHRSDYVRLPPKP